MLGRKGAVHSVDHGPRLASPSTVPSLFPSPEGKERRRKANNPNHIQVFKTHLGRWPTSMLRREAARVPSSPKIFANPQKDLAPTRSTLKWPEGAMAFWKLECDWGSCAFFSFGVFSCGASLPRPAPWLGVLHTRGTLVGLPPTAQQLGGLSSGPRTSPGGHVHVDPERNGGVLA